MTDIYSPDYGALDHPMILSRIFHPRPALGTGPAKAGELMIPVEDGVKIGACFHVAGKQLPTVLFFHGNGEIVQDYDDLGPVYNRAGINFFVVDYRGYGRSTGSATVSAMMKDGHAILDFVVGFLKKQGFSGGLTVMGRSLGSAPAIDLAVTRQQEVDALIVESGFAHTESLLKVLGVDAAAMGIKVPPDFENHVKIARWTGPALIIHGEFDQLIPFSHGKDLFDACQSAEKKLLTIPGAGHNDIFMRGLDIYIDAVRSLVTR